MADDPGHISKEQWAAIDARHPEGFVLVPREPTEHMCIAGFDSDAWWALCHAVLAAKGWPYSCRESAECVAGIFRAMLSAAATAPQCHTTPAASESSCDAARVTELAQRQQPAPQTEEACSHGADSACKECYAQQVADAPALANVQPEVMAPATPKLAEWDYLRKHGQWRSRVPDWARNHGGQVDDSTAMRAIIEELRTALTAQSPGTGSEQ